MHKSTNNFKKYFSRLQPHDLLDDPIAPLGGPDQHQRVERHFVHIRLHRRDGAGVGVARWRASEKRRKHYAGQRNDQTLQADAGIAAQ